MRSVSVFILFFLSLPIYPQDSIGFTGSDKRPVFPVRGFIRAGSYIRSDKDNGNISFPAAFSDFALILDKSGGDHLKAFADVRFRYGAEFGNPVSRMDVREAWVAYTGNRLSISAGQKIIKYGRGDFSNPTSKLCPNNMISRSPDREDMDMGNLLVAAGFNPSATVTLSAVFTPFFRPSVLIIEPVRMPPFVKINKLPSLVTDKNMESWSLKADFHISMIDWSISVFNGVDPVPGLMLDRFELDLSSPLPVIEADLSFKPYRTTLAGFDLETTAGQIGIRAEAAFSVPELSSRKYGYVPMPELKWTAGLERSAGVFRLIAEYSGKYITGFIETDMDPISGNDFDIAGFAVMLADPYFDPEYYVSQQVIAFNRLYNNQLKKMYHIFGMKLDADLSYGRLLPSIFAMYNITSRDLILIPEIKIKPADGLTAVLGADIYTGRKGSLYDLANDFMNAIYISLRADFKNDRTDFQISLADNYTMYAHGSVFIAFDTAYRD